MSTARNWIAGMVAGMAVVSLLTGCGGPSGEPDASSSRSSSPSENVSPSATASSTSSPSADPSSPSTSPSPSSTAPPASPSASSAPVDDSPTPVTLGCLDLVSLDTMYQYNPNFGIEADYSPQGGSLPATAVSHGGIACGWLQQSSGDVIEIAVAQPGPVTLASLRSAASSGTPSSSTSGAEQFFSSSGSIGTLQAFTGSRWVVASSTWFAGAQDAQPLVDSAIAALG